MWNHVMHVILYSHALIQPFFNPPNSQLLPHSLFVVYKNMMCFDTDWSKTLQSINFMWVFVKLLRHFVSLGCYLKCTVIESWIWQSYTVNNELSGWLGCSRLKTVWYMFLTAPWSSTFIQYIFWSSVWILSVPVKPNIIAVSFKCAAQCHRLSFFSDYISISFTWSNSIRKSTWNAVNHILKCPDVIVFFSIKIISD